MNNNNVQFIIPIFHPKKREVSRLLNTLHPYSVVLVDNSDNDNSTLMDARFSDICIYLPQYNNLGYARGVNIGIRYCMNKNCQWMVILNDDIEISKEDVKKAVKFISSSTPGLIGLNIGTLDPVRYSSIISDSNENTDNPLSYVSGEFLAIHTSVIKIIGYFYEPYFMYYEDCDFSFRAKRSGFPLRSLYLSSFTHQETRKGKYFSEKAYYLARNHMLFVERNAPNKVKIHELFRMPKTLYEHYITRNTDAIYGIRDFALRKFGKRKSMTSK